MSSEIPYLGEILALTTGLVWASAVILFRKSGEAMSPTGLNLFKSVVAVVPALITVVVVGDVLRPEVLAPTGLWLLASGALGLGMGDNLFLASLHRLGASRSAIVSCLYSPSIILLSYFYLSETLTTLDLMGGALILSSIVVTSRERRGDDIERRDLLIGVCYGFCAVVVMGASIVVIKEELERSPLIWAASVRLVGGTMGLALISVVSSERREIWSVFRPQRIWWFAIPGSFLGAYVAMICWIGGFKYADASVAALLNQTSTVFTVALAALFLREHLTRARLVAVGLATLGSVLVILDWET